MLVKNIDLTNKTVLVTGVAGFIGANLVINLLKIFKDIKIVGLDNLNDYYDPMLKLDRLEILRQNEEFMFHTVDLKDKQKIDEVFAKNRIDYHF